MKQRKTNDSLILKLHGEGKSQRQIAKELNYSKTCIFKRLKKLLSDGHQAANQQETSDIPGSKYSVTTRYLRKITTGEIFAWASVIAQRHDMQEVRWNGKEFIVVTRTMTRKPY